uniref:Uncharacterized protein n=1 Tax=viral metagenome TaxID=1070528 RepID=A0A6C0HUK0_9ZZZZ
MFIIYNNNKIKNEYFYGIFYPFTSSEESTSKFESK